MASGSPLSTQQPHEFGRDLADPFWLATGTFAEEASSDGLGWRNAHLLLGLARPGPFGPHTLRHPTLSFAIDSDAQVDTTQVTHKLLRPGCMTSSPSGMVGQGRLGNTVRLIVLTLRSDVLEDMACDLCGDRPAPLELLHQYNVVDRCVIDLAHAVAAIALHRDISAAAYADTLLQAIAARLVYRHSNANRCGADGFRPGLFDTRDERDGLDPDEVAAVKDCIESRMDQRLLVEDLARLCDRSPVHFSRLFKRSTGVSPHQYVLASRIDPAKRLLTGSDVAISEVAAQCGFSSQEHLSRRFRTATGTSPAVFRRLGRDAYPSIALSRPSI